MIHRDSPSKSEIKISAQAQEQASALCKTASRVYSQSELAERIAIAAAQNRPLRVKLGMDPTAPDLHLGHAVVLRKLREFQDFGHKAILIVGDFTAMIGDPTGKKKTRPTLSREQVDANAATYLQQAGKILDTRPERLEVRRNSEWLAKMSFADALRLAQQMTVARMLERDTFAERYKSGEAIYIHEFMYPLMQGADSAAIEADIELGGTDQTFNNLVGRDLQVAQGQLPQIVMVMPILNGTDGAAKMSKSLGNYIGISESPQEQFGKVMSIPDSLMREWFELCTDLPAHEITLLCDSTQTHPRAAKERLAIEIVTGYHSAEAAAAAVADFKRRFSDGLLPEHIEDVPVSSDLITDGRIGILNLIKSAGFAASTSEARRLVEGGGVLLAGCKITDPRLQVTLAEKPILQVGKRRVARMIPPG